MKNPREILNYVEFNGLTGLNFSLDFYTSTRWLFAPVQPPFLLRPSHIGLHAVVQTFIPHSISGPLHLLFPLPRTLPRSLYDDIFFSFMFPPQMSPPQRPLWPCLKYPFLITFFPFMLPYFFHKFFIIRNYIILSIIFCLPWDSRLSRPWK